MARGAARIDSAAEPLDLSLRTMLGAWPAPHQPAAGAAAGSATPEGVAVTGW